MSIMVIALGGCRTATRFVEEPRVDMDISNSGNRGYLIGTPPPVSQVRKATRQLIETEIELPSMSRGGGAPPSGAGLRDVAPPEVDFTEPAGSSQEPATRFDTYVVKKGDTLWSIAADPQVFGDATKWRRLFNANQNLMKTPDAIRTGMTLKIPRSGTASSAPSKASKPSKFTKGAEPAEPTEYAK